MITEYKGPIGKVGHTVSLWLKGLPQFADDGVTRKSTELIHWGDGRTATKRYTLRVNNAANFNEFRVDVNGLTSTVARILLMTNGTIWRLFTQPTLLWLH